jgi:hypothetical protein
MHSAPQQSFEEKHGAPLTHVETASVLSLERPKKPVMNGAAVFLSISCLTSMELT